VERLRFIKALRDDAGFSLAEVAMLLEDEAAPRARVTPPSTRRPTLPSGCGSCATGVARYEQQKALLRTQD